MSRDRVSPILQLPESRRVIGRHTGDTEIGDPREQRWLIDGPGEQLATSRRMASAISASTSLCCSITSPNLPAARHSSSRSRQARECQRLAQRET